MSNWFAKNPRKTFALFLALLLLGATFITEKALSLKAHTKKSGITRVIRLREHEPRFAGRITPSDDELRMADSLVPKEYPFRTDGEGFIEPARIHQHPDLNLFFLGGSTTACYYVDEDKRFPALAGRLLEKDTKLQVNSYNSGVGGNFSLHSLDILLNKVIPLKPDIVVIMHNINDLAVLMYAKSFWSKDFKKGNTSPIVELHPKIVDTRLLVDYLIPNLYQELKSLEKWLRHTLRPKKAASQEDELRDFRGKKITLDQEFLVKEFKMNEQLFINICRARNITPVLMTMANRLKENPDPLIIQLTKGLEKDQGISYKEYKEIFDRFNQAIRAVGAANRVLVIDLAQAVPQEKEYIYDLVHFTNRGSELAAGIIKEALQPQLAPGMAGRH
ncbi:MAG: SGNH/GDSL hydrolase family protein [Desulfobaccales bacterium]